MHSWERQCTSRHGNQGKSRSQMHVAVRALHKPLDFSHRRCVGISQAGTSAGRLTPAPKHGGKLLRTHNFYVNYRGSAHDHDPKILYQQGTYTAMGLAILDRDLEVASNPTDFVHHKLESYCASTTMYPYYTDSKPSCSRRRHQHLGNLKCCQ